MLLVLESRGLKVETYQKSTLYVNACTLVRFQKTTFPTSAPLPTQKQTWLFFKFNLQTLIYPFCLLPSMSALFSPNWSTLHLYQKHKEKFDSFGNNEFGTLVLSIFWKVCWHVKWAKRNAFSCSLFSLIGKRMLIRLLTLFQPFESRRRCYDNPPGNGKVLCRNNKWDL